MFLFPLAYITSFIYAIVLLLKKEIKGVLVFIIIGLPIYINTLSVTHMYGFGKLIPYMQAFKEICIIAGFLMVITELKKRPRMHTVDILIAVFFLVSFLYLLLPIGPYDFGKRLLAFKALSMFPVIYFTGRFCKARSINLNHVFSYICIVAIIAASVLVLLEVIPNQHLHSRTGFTDYMIKYYNGETSGNYGLIWTFETETGAKRFGSIYSSPLELSAATILALAAILALISWRRNRPKYTTLYITGIISTLLCIIFALSRASFVNYFVVIYVFAWITRNRKILRYFHVGLALAVIYVAFFLKGDMFDFIISTLNFQNASSIGHIIEWINGINGMIAHPLGMGLGTSGKIAMVTDDQVGGENQLIIIGVQVGIPILIAYTWAYVSMIRSGLISLKTAVGNKKKIILCVVLLKIGLLIPLFTSYLDTFIYITYASYFLSGLMINYIMEKLPAPDSASSAILPAFEPA
jgi:hypothetical protein